MYQVELAKAQMEHEEPLISGFLFHQNAEFRLLELYYNLFHQLKWRKQVRRFGNEFEESLYLALVERELEVCVKPEILAQWDGCDQLPVSKVLLLMLLQICSPKHFVWNTNIMIIKSLASSKKSSDVRRFYVCVVRHTVPMMSPPITLNLAVNISANVYWNKVAADCWKSILVSWTKKLTSLRTIQGCEQTITPLLSKNKFQKVCSFSTQDECSRMMEFTLNRLVCKLFTRFCFRVSCICRSLYKFRVDVFNLSHNLFT